MNQLLSKRLAAVKARLIGVRPIVISIGDKSTSALKHHKDGDLILLDIGVVDAS